MIIIITVMLAGCGRSGYEMPYDYKTRMSAFTFSSFNSEDTASPFASGICVADPADNESNLSGVAAAGLFDINSKYTVYSQNVHNKLYPASLTKVMTALLALKYGHLEDMITASSNVRISEQGAQVIGLKEGDRLTLDQALHALLMYSGNDVSIAIAEYISGSVDEFCSLMNKEAMLLGATNTHFVNPHGLSDEDHYTTAYDLYLIFNEALKYEKFREIISMSEYTTSYSDRDGNPKTMNLTNSNLYLTQEKPSPDGISIIGGKTGTTNMAGSCLILLSNDQKGDPYISVILKADDRDTLYGRMNTMFEEIPGIY